MARPAIDPALLVSSEEAWDALLRDIVNALANAPLPIKRYADFASLPDATQFEDCIACVADTHDPYWSDGTSWVKLQKVVGP